MQHFILSHKRIIVFIISLVLIFNVAFLNPLTVSKSQAFTFAIPLLKTLVLSGISAGMIHITNVSVQNINWSALYQHVSTSWYNALSYSDRLDFDNISSAISTGVLMVKLDLYRRFCDVVNFFLETTTVAPSFTTAGGVVKYANVSYDGETYALPVAVLPSNTTVTTRTDLTTRQVDLSELHPFFVYTDNVSNNTDYVYKDRILYNGFSFLDDTTFIDADGTSQSYKTRFSVGLNNIGAYGSLYFQKHDINSYDTSWFIGSDGNYSTAYNPLLVFSRPNYPFTTHIAKCYFLVIGSSIYGVTDFYNKATNAFASQFIYPISAYIDSNYSSPGYASSMGCYLLQEATDTFVETFPLSASDVDLVIDTSSNVTAPTIETVGNDDYVVITVPETFDLSNAYEYTSADTNIASDLPIEDETTLADIKESIDALNTAQDTTITGEMNNIEQQHDIILGNFDTEGFFDLLDDYKDYLTNITGDFSWLILANQALFLYFLPFIVLCAIFITISRVMR